MVANATYSLNEIVQAAVNLTWDEAKALGDIFAGADILTDLSNRALCLMGPELVANLENLVSRATSGAIKRDQELICGLTLTGDDPRLGWWNLYRSDVWLRAASAVMIMCLDAELSTPYRTLTKVTID